MTNDDSAPFDAAMIALAAVTGKELDTIQKRAYWVALEDVPGDVVVAALRLAMGNCDYFPSAAEIRRLCDEAEAEKLGSFALTPPPAVAQLGPGNEIDVYKGLLPEDPQPLFACPHCRDTSFTHHVCQQGDRCSMRSCREAIRFQGDEATQWHTYVRKCACIVNRDGSTRTVEEGGNKVILQRLARAKEATNQGKYFKGPKKPGRSSYREGYR